MSSRFPLPFTAVQSVFGNDWKPFIQFLREQETEFEELQQWSRSDILEVVKAALPTANVFRTNKLASVLRDFFASAKNTASGAVLGGRTSPSATLMQEDVDRETSVAAQRIERMSFREAVKFLLDIEHDWAMVDVLTRIHPMYLGALQKFIQTSGGHLGHVQRIAALINSDVDHTAELRQEWRNRACYLRGGVPSNAELELVEIFQHRGLAISALGKGMSRPLDELEMLHAKLLPKSSHTPSELPLTMQCLKSFERMFHTFSSNLFRKFTWDGVFVAGGAVLASLRRIVPRQHSKHLVQFYERDHLREVVLRTMHFLPAEICDYICDFLSGPDQFGQSALEKSILREDELRSHDVDVFITADNEAMAAERLQRVASQLLCNMAEIVPEPVRDEDKWRRSHEKKPLKNYRSLEQLEALKKHLRIVRSSNAITLWAGYPMRNVQIIVVLYHSMHEILSFFDLDCVCFGYDGSNVYGLKRAIRALQTRFNFVEPSKLRRWSTGPRILKYAHRGFGTLFFEVCKHTPRCDVVLNEEMTLRIASLNANTDEDSEFNYGKDVSVPFHPRITASNHFDEVMLKKVAAAAYTARRPHVDPADGFIVPPMSATEAEGERIAIRNGTELNDILSLPNLPALRWKWTDLWTSRRGNEFLPRCYVCTERIDPSQTKYERPMLCIRCESLGEAKRNVAPKLCTEVVCVVTGGRIKIGHTVALKLLRCGATVIVTTRFAQDALRRFQKCEDYVQWCAQLHIYGVDFCQPQSLIAFAEEVKRKFAKLHVLINNAAQTIIRPPTYYQDVHLDDADPCLLAPRALQQISCPKLSISSPHIESITSGSSSSLPAVLCERQSDIHGEPFDPRLHTSWTSDVANVSIIEATTTHFANCIAPLHLLTTLLEPLAAPQQSDSPSSQCGFVSGRAFVVNVTSPEGQFSVFEKSGLHPQTNMAKASLNMLTRTVAASLAVRNVFVSSVDTGWISQMSSTSLTKPPLTVEDGAARILDPIFSALETPSEPRCGVLFKHFQVAPW